MKAKLNGCNVYGQNAAGLPASKAEAVSPVQLYLDLFSSTLDTKEHSFHIRYKDSNVIYVYLLSPFCYHTTHPSISDLPHNLMIWISVNGYSNVHSTYRYCHLHFSYYFLSIYLMLLSDNRPNISHSTEKVQ